MEPAQRLLCFVSHKRGRATLGLSITETQHSADLPIDDCPYESQIPQYFPVELRAVVVVDAFGDLFEKVTSIRVVLVRAVWRFVSIVSLKERSSRMIV